MKDTDLSDEILGRLCEMVTGEEWYIGEHSGVVFARKPGKGGREVGEVDWDANDTAMVCAAMTWLGPLCKTVLVLRNQATLDRQSREASQAEFARLNRELNEARDTAQKLAAVFDESSKALGEARQQIVHYREMAGLPDER